MTLMESAKPVERGAPPEGGDVTQIVAVSLPRDLSVGKRVMTSKGPGELMFIGKTHFAGEDSVFGISMTLI